MGPPSRRCVVEESIAAEAGPNIFLLAQFPDRTWVVGEKIRWCVGLGQGNGGERNWWEFRRLIDGHDVGLFLRWLISVADFSRKAFYHVAAVPIRRRVFQGVFQVG